MTSPKPSATVHRIVEYVRARGFDYETDEIEDLNLNDMLAYDYGVRQPLSLDEYDLLREELMLLAEANEIREAVRKFKELEPEDSGVLILREPGKEPGERATSYTMPYSYPVEGPLRGVPKRAPNQAPRQTRKPARSNGGAFFSYEKEPLRRQGPWR